MLEYLCKSVLTSVNDNDDSKDEREQALLDVIQAAGLQAFDLKRLLTLARQAQFWRVCEIIYAEANEYDLILECYLHDRRRKLELFRYIRTLWPALNERQRSKVQEKIMEHFVEIVEAEPYKAFKLFCVFFHMDLGKVLKLLGKNEQAQYGILKVRSREPRDERTNERSFCRVALPIPTTRRRRQRPFKSTHRTTCTSSICRHGTTRRIY